MEFNPGELIHGTTINASILIEKEGLIPAKGAFIRRMYGDEEIEQGESGIFFCNPNDDIGIWSAINAMREAISYVLNKTWHEVTLDDVLMHGALIVVNPYPDEIYLLEEDGTSTTLSGWNTNDDPPTGTEPGNYYSFKEQVMERKITGVELVELAKTVRRYKDEGSFMFNEGSHLQNHREK